MVTNSGSKMMLGLGKAQLSLSLFVLFSCRSRYIAFVELIHLDDLLNDVTFLFLTHQKPRKNLRTVGQTTDRKGTYRARMPSLIRQIRGLGYWLREGLKKKNSGIFH